jgi:hypothetical protein
VVLRLSLECDLPGRSRASSRHLLDRAVVRTERWITLRVAFIEIKKMLKGAFFMLIVSDTVISQRNSSI